MAGGQAVCPRCRALITMTAVQARRAEGLAYARAWRIKNKPIFDALYGPDPVASGRETAGEQ